MRLPISSAKTPVKPTRSGATGRWKTNHDAYPVRRTSGPLSVHYSAIDGDTYDGAPDSGARTQIGYGVSVEMGPSLPDLCSRTQYCYLPEVAPLHCGQPSAMNFEGVRRAEANFWPRSFGLLGAVIIRYCGNCPHSWGTRPTPAARLGAQGSPVGTPL